MVPDTGSLPETALSDAALTAAARQWRLNVEHLRAFAICLPSVQAEDLTGRRYELASDPCGLASR